MSNAIVVQPMATRPQVVQAQAHTMTQCTDQWSRPCQRMCVHVCACVRLCMSWLQACTCARVHIRMRLAVYVRHACEEHASFTYELQSNLCGLNNISKSLYLCDLPLWPVARQTNYPKSQQAVRQTTGSGGHTQTDTSTLHQS